MVNNYNYARFLGPCLDSVLAQTRKPDQLVVVDDGSTDGSMELLRRFEAGAGIRFSVISKANGGQLSAFNAGFSAIDADIICLLDSDDLYLPGYLEHVLGNFERHPEAQVFYSSHLKFFNDGSEQYCLYDDAELPPQFLQTTYLHRFCGAPTSMIAIRRAALGRMLPYDDEAAWRVSADDVLVLGAAAARLCRRGSSAALVRYRIHGGNLYQGRRPDRRRRALRREARTRLLARHADDFAAMPMPARLSCYRDEARLSPRNAMLAYRLFLLAWRLPAGLAGRMALLLAWLQWCWPWRKT